ncbi:ABC transporter substrate-binding protein [Micromonospora sp. NPDC005087]|uniref:ABC transporter substrate-binding protein n=1 Tax=Micromonospora sp. NPDC005087 TaxID=3364225 RepID=UPI00367C54C0
MRSRRIAAGTGRRQLVWRLCVVSLLFLAGCSAGEEGDGRSEITISMVEDADTLDPTFGQTFGGRYVFMHMCEKLYDLTPELEIVPQLAAAQPEVSADGLTVTIGLREGVVFNDGEPFNAEAVKTSLDRHREIEGSARAGELTPVREVRVVDANTVELSLTQPYAPLTAILADRSGMIMSAAKLAELGENFTQEPICVGPYTLTERVVGDRIVLDKSERYYDADKIHIDRVVMRPIPDDTVRVTNLRSGDIDIIDRIPTTQYGGLESAEGITVETMPSLGFDTLMLNTAAGPFQDVRVREAFELALDREEINKTVYGGLHTTSCQPFPSASPYFLDNLTCPQRNATAAAKLLAQAGVSTPVPINLVLLNNTLSVRRGELIQAQAAQAGFEVNVRPTEVGTLINDAASGNFDAVVLTWSGRADPDGNLATFEHTDGGQNFGKASTPEIDASIEAARRVTNPAERATAYADAWELARQRHSEIVLMNPNLLAGWRDQIQGLQLVPDGLIRLKGVSLRDNASGSGR